MEEGVTLPLLPMIAACMLLDCNFFHGTVFFT